MADTKAKSDLRTADHPSRPTLVYAALLAVVTAYGLHAMLISGPAMRAAARAELERTIADEDRDVCGSFGMRPGTREFVACSRELANVRQRQSDRETAAAQGIL